tara:strand:+ start:132 stop:731 length:600 start_codon:yes stop_codon:yes gene_type:complete
MNELIQIIKILDTNQVKKINKYVDTLDFQDNTVFGKGNGPSKTNTDIRSSTGATLKEDAPETIMLHEAMNAGLLEYKRRCTNIHQNFSYYPMPGAVGTDSWREGLQVLDYKKGQQYKFHHDAATDRRLGEYHRKISIITYLKNATKGGGTIFPHTSFKPSPGYALMFPSNWCYPHSGEPVISGKKRVAVTWYYVKNNSN